MTSVSKLVVTSHPLHPASYSWGKRLIDVIGSLLGLSILGIIFIPIAIAIKFDSPGSIFFCQRRYGLAGKSFKLYKFRTMVSQAEALKYLVHNEVKGAMFKNRNDPRITRVGQFLRRTSLDEFPQFLNVLKGEMSLVGTRPPSQDEVIYYSPYHWQRLNVKPGITGEWQVYGRSEIMNFEQVFELDLRYQKRWSLAYDFLLLVKTIYVVLTFKGAY